MKISGCHTEHATVLWCKNIQYCHFLNMLALCLCLVIWTIDASSKFICQNDALRLCTRVRLNDHVRIEDLHDRCKIISLERRRHIQLLLLMYRKSKDITMHKVLVRKSRRIVFKTDTSEGTLYKCRSFFIGTKHWDALSIDVIELPDIFTFKAKLQRLKCNIVYDDPLA